MSERRRVNPLLSFGWRPTGEGGALAFCAYDPLSNRSLRLAPDELWLPGFLDGALDRGWTQAELAEAAARAGGGAAALERLWPLAFVAERDDEPQRAAALRPWEDYGCKLALEAYAASLAAPDEAGPEPFAPHEPAADAGAPAADDDAPALRALPLPRALPATPLDALLARRRTVRAFGGRALALDDLAFVLGHGLGSALGAPPAHLVCHLIVLRADGIAPGVYEYRPGAHALRPVRAGAAAALEAELIGLLAGQRYAAGSAVAVLLAGDLDRVVAERRHPAALRTWLIGLGALAQRLILLGQACGADSFLSAAIDEARARALTGSGPGVVPFHQVAFGYRAGAAD